MGSRALISRIAMVTANTIAIVAAVALYLAFTGSVSLVIGFGTDSLAVAAIIFGICTIGGLAILVLEFYDWLDSRRYSLPSSSNRVAANWRLDSSRNSDIYGISQW